ncbi:uncharacterized protein LOC143892046 [Tasmannia lanceolata]|uniref:uncharacterized protein LOC143892046 n=1 Tax=Tasmannia lanceolata TaxID=3420 RepID=UPI00406374F0
MNPDDLKGWILGVQVSTLFTPLQNSVSQKLCQKISVSPFHFSSFFGNQSSDAKCDEESDQHVKAPGPAGVGGVLRNEIGKILWAYAGGTDATETEVRAVHQGLELIQKIFLNRVVIEGVSSNVAEIPDGFPFETQDEAEIPEWFKVGDKDIPGHLIFLKRHYEGETILVKFRIPDDLVTGDEGKDDNDDENNDDIKGGQYNLRLIIYICKGYLPNLVLTCLGYREKISFDGMFYPVKPISEDEVLYEGPDFNVPGAFEKYLEIRGIKPSTIIHFLHEYMIKRAKST